METRKIFSTIGTFVIVGAASMAGAALWTNVLDGKIKLVKAQRASSGSNKVIVVDFRKGTRNLSR